MSYPFKWKPVSKELEAKRHELFDVDSTYRNGVTSEPLDISVPYPMPEVAKKIYNFKVRPDDIWIITYPKCGTTWTQELVWQIVNKVDVETARRVPLWARSPFIEMEGLWTEEIMAKRAASGANMSKNIAPEHAIAMVKSVEFAENLQSPRVIKSHLPLEMLPPNLVDTCKVIFVCRTPKDCCVSYYNHHLTIPDYHFKGMFSDFAKLFLEGSLEFGNYWTMLKSAWKYKDHPNMKILWFEDMKKDLVSVIKDVASFAGYHITQYKTLVLDDHLYIDNFRQLMVDAMGGDPGMKKFIRKGQVGDWKNYFNEENSKIWDKWIAENLSGTDIVLPDH